MKTLTGPCTVKVGDSVLACCSGGIDSMVLLDLLMQASGPLHLKVGVVHVEHGIRGEESRKDALFVSSFCEKLGIPCHVYDLGMSSREPNLEERARIGRYGKISGCMGSHGYSFAATGHNLDDQAETIVYRLIRGSGIRGLAGMEHLGANGIVRPMLSFTRLQVVAHAHERGIPYVEDGTNLDMKHARNLIRKEIIPHMERINPLAKASIARLGNIAREEGGHLDELSDDLEQESLVMNWGTVRAYRLAVLKEAPLAVLKRMIIRVVSSTLQEPRGIDASQVEEVMEVVQGNRKGHTIKRRIAVRADADALVFCPAWQGPFYCVDIQAPGIYPLAPLDVSVQVAWVRKPVFPLVLTSTTKGERFHGKRVSKLLAERGVMKSIRPFWPLLVSGGKVVSIAGLLDVSDGQGLETEFPCHVSNTKG